MSDNRHTHLVLGKLLVKPGLRDKFRTNPREALIAAGVDPATVDINRVTRLLQSFSGSPSHVDRFTEKLRELLKTRDGIVK